MADLYDNDILLWSERQGEQLRRRAAGELVKWRKPTLLPCGSGSTLQACTRRRCGSCRTSLRRCPQVCPVTLEEFLFASESSTPQLQRKVLVTSL